jgi:eukaryotic-like serine/threonine-protein kinase
MALVPDTRIGPYEVLAQIGTGGMGEVYRARDTKLNRDVALKILPEAFTLDGDRIARFRREAQVLASLNHPNIAAIYGFEDSGSTHALVLELVEGPTLADRIAKGPISLDEALPIAKQIAEALEIAHEQGIIHRDLKPANIKLRDDGTVKVLDFGLAKAMEPASAISPGLTASPTITTPAQMTGVGMILGTAGYMSPEQAKGRPADKRSDIWAFGCVLYEMLTGKRAFEGEDVSDTLAAVLRGEPDWSALPADAHYPVSTTIKKCLEKDRKRRIPDISAVRFLLDDVAPRPTPAGPPVAAPPRTLWRGAIGVAIGALAAGVTTVAIRRLMTPTAPPPVVTRFRVTFGESQLTSLNRNELAISPDGTQLAYIAGNRLYVRRMSELEARPLTAEGPDQGTLAMPVFSPDGGFIAFYSNETLGASGTIKKIAVGGGVAVTLASQPMTPPYGLSWGSDGIVFVEPTKGVMRLPSSGGTPELLVALRNDELAYGAQMLPDGTNVLFTVSSSSLWETGRVVVESLKSHERKTVLEGGADARFVSTGHLLYASSGILFAVPFDIRRLQSIGGAMPVVEGIRRAANATPAAFFDVSRNGTLVYAPGPASSSFGSLDVGLIDKSGMVTPLKLPPASYEFPRVSPDGKRIAVHSGGKDANIWVYDLSGTTQLQRLTNGSRNLYPVWSFDSQRVTFQSDREGDQAIFWQAADGRGAAERLTKPEKDTAHIPESWSPDGKHLLFDAVKGATSTLWTFSLQDRKSMPFGEVQSVYLPAASFSPDGRWVVYQTTPSVDGSGGGIYIQPFPPTGDKFLVTTTGIHPFWSPDGSQLLYRRRGQTIAVKVTTRPTVAFGNAVLVNTGPYRERGPQVERELDITPDGNRFVGVISGGSVQSANASLSELHVVTNWFEELRQRVPVK